MVQPQLSGLGRLGCGVVALVVAGLAVAAERSPVGSPLPEMVAIPEGCFTMGSPVTELGRRENETSHRLCLAGFAIGRYEVTYQQFAHFVAATGYAMGQCDQPPGRDWRRPGFSQGEQWPVICVSLVDALAYTDWLSLTTGAHYRLPTEAEWEYAARAATTTPYWWGEQASHEWANYGTDECCNGLAEGRDRWPKTAPVGSFAANPWGLYDTAGNVWEWTCSVWDFSRGYDGREQRCQAPDGVGEWVARGGSWYDEPNSLRSALRGFRDHADPHSRGRNLGFRVVRETP